MSQSDLNNQMYTTIFETPDLTRNSLSFNPDQMCKNHKTQNSDDREGSSSLVQETVSAQLPTDLAKLKQKRKDEFLIEMWAHHVDDCRCSLIQNLEDTNPRNSLCKSNKSVATVQLNAPPKNTTAVV